MERAIFRCNSINCSSDTFQSIPPRGKSCNWSPLTEKVQKYLMFKGWKTFFGAFDTEKTMYWFFLHLIAISLPNLSGKHKKIVTPTYPNFLKNSKMAPLPPFSGMQWRKISQSNPFQECKNRAIEDHPKVNPEWIKESYNESCVLAKI